MLVFVGPCGDRLDGHAHGPTLASGACPLHDLPRSSLSEFPSPEPSRTWDHLLAEAIEGCSRIAPDEQRHIWLPIEHAEPPRGWWCRCEACAGKRGGPPALHREKEVLRVTSQRRPSSTELHLPGRGGHIAIMPQRSRQDRDLRP